MDSSSCGVDKGIAVFEEDAAGTIVVTRDANTVSRCSKEWRNKVPMCDSLVGGLAVLVVLISAVSSGVRRSDTYHNQF